MSVSPRSRDRTIRIQSLFPTHSRHKEIIIFEPGERRRHKNKSLSFKGQIRSSDINETPALDKSPRLNYGYLDLRHQKLRVLSTWTDTSFGSPVRSGFHPPGVSIANDNSIRISQEG